MHRSDLRNRRRNRRINGQIATEQASDRGGNQLLGGCNGERCALVPIHKRPHIRKNRRRDELLLAAYLSETQAGDSKNNSQKDGVECHNPRVVSLKYKVVNTKRKNAPTTFMLDTP